LWATLLVSLILSFSALLYLGGQIYQQAPPIPNAVQIVNGRPQSFNSKKNLNNFS
jgi:nitric oxide reductase subunit B